MTAIGSMYSVGSGAGRWRAILALIRKGREVLAHKKLPGRCCAAAARPSESGLFAAVRCLCSLSFAAGSLGTPPAQHKQAAGKHSG